MNLIGRRHKKTPSVLLIWKFIYKASQTNNRMECILNYRVTFYVCALLHLTKEQLYFNYVFLCTFAFCIFILNALRKQRFIRESSDNLTTVHRRLKISVFFLWGFFFLSNQRREALQIPQSLSYLLLCGIPSSWLCSNKEMQNCFLKNFCF